MAAHVLIADDEPQILTMVSEILKKRGYTFDLATDGLQALECARRHKPDVLVTDVMMPKLDGWTLVRELRADPALARLPVIFVTALTARDDRLRAFRLGADDYINKPFQLKDLIARIDGAIDRPRAPVEASTAGLNGDLSQVALSTLLVLIEMERKTGILQMRATNGRTAFLFLRDGRIIDARLDGAGPWGVDCVYQLLTWTSGKFEFSKQAVDGPDRIEASTTYMLMESARRTDEANANVGAPDPNLDDEAIAEWNDDQRTPMMVAAKLAGLVHRSAQSSNPPPFASVPQIPLAELIAHVAAEAAEPRAEPRAAKPPAAKPPAAEPPASPAPAALLDRAAEPRPAPAAEAPRGAKPPAAKPPAAEPRAAEPRATEPRAAEPRATEPRAAEPRAAEPRAAKPPAAKPPAAKPPAAEPPASPAPAALLDRAAEPRAAPAAEAPRGAKPRAAEPRAAEPPASPTAAWPDRAAEPAASSVPPTRAAPAAEPAVSSVPPARAAPAAEAPRGARRATWPWLAAALVAAAAGAASFFVPSAVPTSDRSLLQGDAVLIAKAIDQAAESAHLRADGFAALPMLRAGIETDAATLQDMASNEALMKAAPNEIIEIFQSRDGHDTSLLRMPASAPPLEAASLRTDGTTLWVVARTAIKSQSGALAGTIAVAEPADFTAAKRSLVEHAAGAALTTTPRLVVVSSTTQGAAPMTLPLSSTAAPQLSLVVDAAPAAADAPSMLPIVRLACFAAGALLLAVFVTLRARRDAAAA